jgi:hydroxymethylbilane synthase
MNGYLAPLHDPVTTICVNTERAFLAELDGSCQTPIAGLARVDGEKLHFRGQILLPDGSLSYETERNGSHGDGRMMGIDAARELLEAAGPDFLRAVA